MLNEHQIIQLCKSGRTDLYGTLIERHKDSLYKFCYHLTSSRQDADDLFQDTWVKVIRNLNGYDENKRFTTWVFSIALNQYRDGYRKARRWLGKMKHFFTNDEKERQMNNAASAIFLPEEQVIHAEQKKVLIECIHMLDDDFRLPLILFYFKEVRYEDIAEILNVPVGTVKSRLNAAKGKLKKLMEVKGLEG